MASRNIIGFFLGSWMLLAVMSVPGQTRAQTPPPSDEKPLPDWMEKRLRGLDDDKEEPGQSKGKEEKAEKAEKEESMNPSTTPVISPADDGAPIPAEEEPKTPVPSSSVDIEKDEIATVEEEVPPVEEEASPSFHLGRLFSLRSIKPPPSEERYVVGVYLRMAPVRAVIKSELDNLKKEYPDLEEGLQVLREVDLDELDARIKALDSSVSSIPEEYFEQAGLDKSQQDLLKKLDTDALQAVIDIANDPEDAVTFSLEPYITMNFDLIALTVMVPLAGFSHGGETSFDLGNITADLRFGHVFGPGPTFGLSYGITVHAPTGTQRADALALTSVLEGPRFLHAYLGLEPYLLMGLDLRYLLLQADVGVSDLIRIRGDQGEKNTLYMRYGFGLSIVPSESVAIVGEIVGGVGIQNADAFDIHTLTAGLRFAFAGIELAAAVQLPLVAPGNEAYGNNEGLAFGSPADINGLLELDVAF